MPGTFLEEGSAKGKKCHILGDERSCAQCEKRVRAVTPPEIGWGSGAATRSGGTRPCYMASRQGAMLSFVAGCYGLFVEVCRLLERLASRRARSGQVTEWGRA